MAGPEGWRDKEVTDLGHLLDPTGMFSLDKTICFGAYGKIDLELHEKTGSFMAIKVMNVRKTPLPGIGRRVRVNKCPKSVGWRYSDEEEDLRTVSLLRKYSSHKTVLSFYGAFFSLSPPGQRYQLWMVMELYAAGSVTDIVRVTRKQSLKEGWIAYICREILQGLAHLHAHQVIHQDIRGQNVLLTHNAEVKLVDFGVSAQVSRTNGRRNSFIGTPYWMAPEGINSDANPRRSDDYRSGVQSMGITAIEMAEGTPRYDNCQLRGDSFPKPQLSDGDFQDLAPLEALFVSLQDAAPKVKSSGWSPKFHSFMEKCMIKNVPFHPPSGSMIHHPFVHDIENERHVVESLKKHLTGIMQKRQIKDIPLVFEEEAVFKELYTTKGFREPSCTQELLRMPTSSKCTQSRWWPLPEEPQVQAGQQLQVAASVFMVLHAPDNAPKPLQRQAQEAQCLHGAAQGFMPPQAQAEARESTPSVPQMQAPPRLMGAGRVLMPLPTQGTEAEVQARVPKEQQAQTESLETEQPQDLDQVPEEFQGQDRAPEPQRQGQAAEQQQRQNPVPEQHVEQDEVPEQAEVQEEAVEPPQAEMAEKEPELVQVHARVFLPLLSQNHYVLLPLHLDTQLLIPVGEQDNESPRAQAWALEASQAFGAVQALVDGLSRNLLQAPNGSVSKPLGPLQILLENLSSNMFYTQPEEPQKKKSRVSSLKHALAKRLSPKRFRAKALWRVEDFEFSDIEAGRRRRQRRWEEIFNQHEEELREVGNDREDDSSDNDEVFHSVQAEVQVEPCAQNPAGNEVQERSASMSYSRNRAHRVKFSPSVCQESLLEEEIQEPKDTRQSSPINIQNCQAQSESSSEEASPVTRRKSQSSPPYSTIDQNLLIDIHVPDGFKVGKISPPVYLTNDWVGPSAPSEMFWDDWLIPPPARQPPVEDGDYVELYDTGANTDGEASNGAYEDAYGRGRDLNNQADQAYACRDYDDDDYDESLGAAYNRPRSRYYRRGILKRVGNDGRERKRGDFRAYGNNGARSYYGNAASGACAAFGNPEGYEANIDDRRGNRYRGANGGSEENGAFGFYGEEAHSQRDGLGLDQYEFQDFEHEQEESDGGTETSDSIALEIASFGPDDEPNNDRPESSPAAGFPITRASRRDSASDTDSASAILYNKPLIHVYEKEFSSEICCGSLWGVNLLLGTRSNLYLMDRSGKADVIKLIKRRPFRQIQVVEPLNLLITISGRKNRLRVYHLTWLRNKILNNDPGSKKRQKAMLKTQEACKAIDKLTGCEHFSVLQHEETTYIAVALKSSIHLFAWAPKSFDENTAIKVFRTPDFKPVTVDLSIGTEKTLKIFFSSANGYHIIDAESGVMSDVTLPNNNIIMLPDCLGIGVMLTFNAETASEEANEQVMKKILDVWKDIPTSTAFECTQRITGWDQKAIEVRSLQASILENEMKRKSIKKLRFLCARGDKLFFSSTLSNRRSRVYFMTLGKLEELQRNYAL